MSRYSQFSPKIRRSKKLSCKDRGGVVCKVSRRERHFPNTCGPSTSHSGPRIILSFRSDSYENLRSDRRRKTRQPKNCGQERDFTHLLESTHTAHSSRKFEETRRRKTSN